MKQLSLVLSRAIKADKPKSRNDTVCRRSVENGSNVAFAFAIAASNLKQWAGSEQRSNFGPNPELCQRSSIVLVSMAHRYVAKLQAIRWCRHLCCVEVQLQITIVAVGTARGLSVDESW